eukprot:6348844-Amphidinium_carterae.1
MCMSFTWLSAIATLKLRCRGLSYLPEVCCVRRTAGLPYALGHWRPAGTACISIQSSQKGGIL